MSYPESILRALEEGGGALPREPRRMVFFDKFIGHSADWRGTKLLLSALLQYTTVALIISGYGFGPEVAACLAQSIKCTAHRLQHIFLRSCALSSAGAVALARALSFANITKFSAIYASISDSGAIALAEFLEHNPPLRVLVLSGNCIGNVGARALAESLHTNTHLKELRLDLNHITLIGVRAFEEALGPNDTLTSLSLENNNFPVTHETYTLMRAALRSRARADRQPWVPQFLRRAPAPIRRRALALHLALMGCNPALPREMREEIGRHCTNREGADYVAEYYTR